MNEQLNVTGVGIAVALAVVVAGGFLFFGPNLLSFLNPSATQPKTAAATNQTQPMQDETQASTTGMEIPQNVTELMGKDLVVGTGVEAKAGDTVKVNYVGKFTNGQVFDASANHGNDGFTFHLGAGDVIKGWDQGVQGMKVGGKRLLIVPPALGYGAQQMGPIPANSTLVFEVELLKVN